MLKGRTPSPVTEQRKRICKTLTHVLQQSELNGAIDAKALYMLLSSNFAVLARGDGLDLTPLWGSLQGTVGDDPRLVGLFLGFEHSLYRLGLSCKMPPTLTGMTPENRDNALARAFSGDADEAIIESLTSVEGSVSTGEMPVLETHDLRPLVDEEQKRAIVGVVVHHLRTSAVGERIDGGQLAYRIDQFFSELCDGRTFNLAPVLESLRKTPGFPEAAAARDLPAMAAELREMGVRLEAPGIDLETQDEEGHRTRSRWSPAQAEPTVQPEREDPRATVRPEREEPRPADRPEPEPKSPEPGRSGPGTRRERDLRRYHLLGISPQRWRLVRLSGMALALVAALTYAWLTRPERDLDPSKYPLPLTAAGLKAGTFVATLDDGAWYALSLEERPDRVAAMEQVLRAEGHASEARIVDGQGRLVIMARPNGSLRASRYVLESPDGVRPPPPGEARRPGDVAKRPPTPDER